MTMVGITFGYNITLPYRSYVVGEVIEQNGKTFRVRALGKSFVVYLDGWN